MKQRDETRRQREQIHYVPARLDETTASALAELARQDFDGNKSAAIRQAIRAYSAVKQSETVQTVAV